MKGRPGLCGLVVIAAVAGCNSGGGSSNRASATAPVSSAAPVTSGVVGTPPAVAVQTPAPVVSSTVRLDFVLTDGEASPAQVAVEYSVDDGRTFLAATSVAGQATQGLASSPTGVAHAFLWDAGRDAGRTLRHFVRLRVTPSDADGAGVAASTATFSVDATAQAVRLANLVVPLDPAGADRVVSYDVSTQGALTRRAAQPAASGRGRQMSSASGIVATPRGDLVVVSHNDSKQLDVFAVSAAGDLTPVAGSPFTCAANPTALAMHPGGRFVYATNGAALEAFSLDPATGALAPLPGSPFLVGSSPRGLAVDPRGDALYTGHMFGNEAGLRVHRLDPATGAPTFASALTLTGASRPGSVVAVDPRGERLYALDLDAGVFVATIDAQTRALTPVAGASPRSLGGFAHALALTTRGDKLYATVSGVGLVGFRVTATGSLVSVPGSPLSNVGSTSLYLQADASDHLLFASSRGSDWLQTFAIEPVTGALVEVPGSPRYDLTLGAVVGPLAPLAPR